MVNGNGTNFLKSKQTSSKVATGLDNALKLSTEASREVQKEERREVEETKGSNMGGGGGKESPASQRTRRVQDRPPPPVPVCYIRSGCRGGGQRVRPDLPAWGGGDPREGAQTAGVQRQPGAS